MMATGTLPMGECVAALMEACEVAVLAPALSTVGGAAEVESPLSVEEAVADGAVAPPMVGVALPTTAWAVAMVGDTAADMEVTEEEEAIRGTTAGDIQVIIRGTTDGDIQAVIWGTTAGDIPGTTAGDISGTTEGDIHAVIWGTTAGDIPGTTEGDIKGTTAEFTRGTVDGGTEAAIAEINTGIANYLCLVVGRDLSWGG